MNNTNNGKKINTILNNIDFGTKKIVGNTENTDQKKAIIYARVSTEEQVKEGYGIESQINACKQFALSKDIEVVRIFKDEGISGSKLDRVGLNNAINFLQKANQHIVKVHYFITTEASRISRSENLIDTLEIDQKIKSTGAEILYTMHPTDTSTDEGKFIQNFQYLIASYERSKIKQRTINGIKSKIYQGLRPWVVPLGYEEEKIKVGNKTERILKLKEPESIYLKEALELYANGMLEYKYDIINYLNNKGVRKNGKKLHKSLIDRILEVKKMIFYAGYLIWPERGITEFIPGQHEPLIDLSLAKKVLLRLENRGRHHNKALLEEKERLFPFKGFLYCPFCGKPMSAAYSSNRKGLKYGYYYCFNNACSEKKKSFSEKELDECFITYLSRIQIKEPLWKIFKMFLEYNWQDKEKMLIKLQGNKKQRLKEIKSQIQDIEEKILKLTNNSLIKKLEQTWAELEQEASFIEKELDNKELLEINWKELYKKAEFLFHNPAGLFEAGDENIKKIIIKLFADKIFVVKKTSYEKLVELGIELPFVKQGNKFSSTSPTGVVSKNYLFRTTPNNRFQQLFDYILDAQIPNLDLTGIEPVYRSKAIQPSTRIAL